MKLPTRADFGALMQEREGPCVSFFLPTHRPGTELQPQDRIRLKNMIREAEELLVKVTGQRPTEARQLLQPVTDLETDGNFWRNQVGSLALYRSPDAFLYYQSPFEINEQVVVGHRFYVKPLLPVLSSDGTFFILAISQNASRLLRCTRYTQQELKSERVPENLQQALRYDDRQRVLDFHTDTQPATGERPAEWFGQGVGKDDEKLNIVRYFFAVDKGLHRILHDQKAPLVLASVGYLLPLYQEANTYPHLLDRMIEGNPEEVNDTELRNRGWSIVGPLFERARRSAEEDYRRLSGTPRASNSLDEIVRAAYEGRVDSVFVSCNVQRWGTFDPNTLAVTYHEGEQPGDQDLLDLIVVQTLQHDGSVYVMGVDQVPDGSKKHPVSAVFRY